MAGPWREEILGDGQVRLILGDCREVLPTLGKVDAVVTDPPYSVSVPGVGRWEMRYGRTDDLDFFEGDHDWEAMTSTVCEAAMLDSYDLERCFEALIRKGSHKRIYKSVGWPADVAEDIES